MRTLRASQAQPYSFDRIVGISDALNAVKALLRKIASSPASTVLLAGESGTGKDLAAKVIHYNSGRANRSFMNITCSALPENLLESELFGHERGAFTGADRQKRGLLEMADGGTVFLDEVGEMMPALQAKLLRFLEEKTFRRVGGSADIHVDVRVVAATNKTLQDEVRAGKFREDLFYRLNVLPIVLPPCASARRHPAARLLPRRLQRRVQEERWVTPEALKQLNVRMALGTSASSGTRSSADASPRATPTVNDFTLGGAGPAHLSTSSCRRRARSRQLERSLVVQALERTGWNQTRASALLGLNRDQIRYRIEKFHLEKTTS